jgi:hypothetical protein
MTDLRFGVELEFFLPPGVTRPALAAALAAVGVETSAQMYNHHSSTAWKLVTDGSLGDYDRGTELVSPILQGNAGLDAAARAAEALTAQGCTVDRRCGYHVHVEAPADQAQAVAFFKDVVGLYAKHESTIDTLVAPSRRGSNNTYCRAVGDQPARFKSARTLNSLRSAYNVNFRPDLRRYRKVNMESYWRHGTVEFRQHQGTVDSRKVRGWAAFCLKMVEAASRAQQPTRRIRRSRRADYVMQVSGPNPHSYGSVAHEAYQLYRSGATLADLLPAGADLMRRRSGATSRDPARAFVAYYVRPDERRGAISFVPPSGGGEAPVAAQIANSLDALMGDIGADAGEVAYFRRRQTTLARMAL